MQIGMIGLGRMGSNMVHRLLAGGHRGVVFNRSAKAVEDLARANAVGASSLPDLVKKLPAPSWLLDLSAAVLIMDPELKRFEGRVSDSGEGRWTIKAAIDEAVPAHVLSSALYERFSSRGGSRLLR